jgi:hypothetical protein
VTRARRWSAAAFLLSAACAHQVAPTGGPEDKTGPLLLASSPDSMAVVPGFRGPVAFLFDERVSERGLREAILVSPNTSEARLDHGGDEVKVTLARGWRPNTVYQVRIDRTPQDLFGNRLAQPVEVVFSTGPEIPDTRTAGRVADRVTGGALVGGRVEAVAAADSLVYLAVTDSAGGFELRHLPAGDYLVRAYNDVNRDRQFQDFEPRDSAVVRVGATLAAETRLAVVLPDTSAPVFAPARLENGVVVIPSDDYLDPEQSITAAQVRITAPDGSAVRIAEGRVGEFAVPVQADSAGGPGVPDSVNPRRPDSSVRRAAADSARDTTRLLTPASQRISVRTADSLAWDTEYRVTIQRVRNVVGLEGGGEVALRTGARPAAPPPAAAVPAGDSAGVSAPGAPPADSARPVVAPPPGEVDRDAAASDADAGASLRRRTPEAPHAASAGEMRAEAEERQHAWAALPGGWRASSPPGVSTGAAAASPDSAAPEGGRPETAPRPAWNRGGRHP